jgi:molecular chaperone GrpE
MAEDNKSNDPETPEEVSETFEMPGVKAGETSSENAEADITEFPAEFSAENPVEGGVPSPEEQIADLKDKLLRALAENENIIRRARREREDAGKYAAANFARDMLSVGDNLHRALAAIPAALRDGDAETKAFIEGVEMTGRELLSVLERHGIVRISPLGEKFDHDRHEALFEVPTADADPGIVVQVLEDGFMVHDRLLRPARVGVAKALADPGETEGHAIDTSA